MKQFSYPNSQFISGTGCLVLGAGLVVLGVGLALVAATGDAGMAALERIGDAAPGLLKAAPALMAVGAAFLIFGARIVTGKQIGRAHV